MKSVADAEQTPPPAFVWENVTTELDGDKSKRPVLLIWLFGIGLAFAAVAGYYWLQGKDNSAMEMNQSKLQFPTVEVRSDSLIQTESVTEDVNDSADDHTSTISNGLSEESGNAANYERLKQGDASSLGADHHSITEEIGETTTQVAVDNVSLQSEIIHGQDIISSDSNPSAISQSRVTAKVTEARAMVPSARSVASVQALSLPARALPVTETVQCPTFSKTKISLPLFAELSGLIGSHQKTLAGGSILANVRSQSESSWLDYGISAAMGVYLHSDLYIMAGIESSQATDRFNRSREGVTKMIVDLDIETGLPTDTSFVTGNVEDRGLVRYTMLDIPITLGYRRLIGNWSIGAELGLLANISFSAKGKIIAADGSVGRIEDFSPEYKANVGMGYKGSLVLGRYFSNGISLQSKVTYKSYLQDVQHPTYTVPTSFDFVRVELGIRNEF